MSLMEHFSTVDSRPDWPNSGTAYHARNVQITGRLAMAMAAADLVAIVFGYAAGLGIAEILRPLAGAGSVASWEILGARAYELAVLTVLTIAIFAFGGLYRRSGWELNEIRMIVAGVGLVALFDTAQQFLQADHNSRMWFLLAYPLIALAVICGRMILRTAPAVAEAMTSHVVLIGNGVRPDRLAYEMRESRSGPVRMLSYLDIATVASLSPGELNTLIDTIAHAEQVPTHRVQIVIAPAADEIARTQDLLATLNRTQRHYGIVLPFTGLARNGLGLQKVIGADMVMAEMRPVTPPLLTRVAKRVFDIVVSGTILILIAPAMAVLTALLAVEKGPILFTQLRVGRGGERFRCFKFRTMRPDAQERLQELLASDPAAREEWNRYQELQDDPRITRIGHFLRKTSLDELPQLLNVLRGEMSLVGPRPIIAPEIEGYPGDRAYYSNPDFIYYKRCTPGISGLWQVSGRSDTSHDERVRLDRWYARNMSFWLDVTIMFKTVRTVLGRSGSV